MLLREFGATQMRPDDALAVLADERRLHLHRHVVRIGEQEERVELDGGGAEGALLALGERPLRPRPRWTPAVAWPSRHGNVGVVGSPADGVPQYIARSATIGLGGRHADAERGRRQAGVERAAFLVDPDGEALARPERCSCG